MAKIPDPYKRRFYHKKWFAEAIAGIATLVAAVPAYIGWKPIVSDSANHTSAELETAWIGISGIILLIGAVAVKIAHGRMKDKEETDISRFDGLKSGLEMIYSIAVENSVHKPPQSATLRVTIHRVVSRAFRRPPELEQVLDYVGGDKNGAGRKLPCHCGISGWVARNGKVAFAERTYGDLKSYTDHMVDEWSFDMNQAKALKTERQSWMAVPLLHNSEATGVIYLDSDKIDFFSPAVRTQVIWACGGLAQFINERWS